MLDLNDILPRYWTDTEIVRKTQQVYNERNGVFAGMLYPYEESAEPLVYMDSWPKSNVPGKIVK